MAGIRISITPDPRDMAQVVRSLNALKRVGGKPRRALGRTGLFIRREAQRLLRARVKEWGPHTGKLAKSLTMLLDDLSVIVGSNLIYAAIQQLGGEIRPKGHPYLAIPVQPHLRRAGVWPRDLPKGSMKFVPNARITIGARSWTGPALVRATAELSDLEGKARGRYRQNKDARGRFAKGGTRDAANQAPQTGEIGEVMFALIRRARIKGQAYLVFESPAKQFLLRELSLDYTRAWRSGRSS